jgi:hypothetical protein
MRVFAYVGGSHIRPSGLRLDIEALAPDAIIEDMRSLPGLLELHAARETGQASMLVAVDVGTASARAGVVTPSGRLIGRAEHPLELNRVGSDIAEYDSEQIWDAVAQSVRSAMRLAGVKADEILGTVAEHIDGRGIRPQDLALGGDQHDGVDAEVDQLGETFRRRGVVHQSAAFISAIAISTLARSSSTRSTSLNVALSDSGDGMWPRFTSHARSRVVSAQARQTLSVCSCASMRRRTSSCSSGVKDGFRYVR